MVNLDLVKVAAKVAEQSTAEPALTLPNIALPAAPEVAPPTRRPKIPPPVEPPLPRPAIPAPAKPITPQPVPTTIPSRPPCQSLAA